MEDFPRDEDADQPHKNSHSVSNIHDGREHTVNIMLFGAQWFRGSVMVIEEQKSRGCGKMSPSASFKIAI